VAEENAKLAKQNEARANALTKVATSRQLATLSVVERDERFDRSLLLAVEAVRTENTLEARDALYRALQDRLGLRSFLHIPEGEARSVAFSPDGKTIAAAYEGRDGGVVLWDVASRMRLGDAPLAAADRDVNTVAFSPDGKTIAAGYGGHLNRDEGGVVLWDVASRKRLGDQPLAVNDDVVFSVAFSPDGKTIAAAHSIRGVGVVLWNVAARTRLGGQPLAVKRDDPGRVTLSPDGKSTAGYGIGPDVVLWDIAAHGRLLREPLAEKEGEVSSVAFSPDGKSIAVGYGYDNIGAVVLWDVDLESWQRRAGRIANHSFTRQECGEYFPDTPYRATFADLPVPPEATRKWTYSWLVCDREKRPWKELQPARGARLVNSSPSSPRRLRLRGWGCASGRG
jgi:WD40 repeat protein